MADPVASKTIVVSALGYGDCLITLSLLEQSARLGSSPHILGTQVTAAVSGLLNQQLPVEVALHDAAAFYTVKSNGLRAGVSDWLRLRRKLADVSKPRDVIAFERNDIRTRSLLPCSRNGVYARYSGRVYADRQAWVAKITGTAPSWPALARPNSGMRTLLINPSARATNRCIAAATISHLLEIAKEQGWTVTLLDPCERYGTFRDTVTGYHPRPTLDQSAALLRATDLYIGPDSFFIHLAYYYDVPFFGFFFPHHHDFLIPGMEQAGNYLDFESARDRAQLQSALLRFVSGETT